MYQKINDYGIIGNLQTIALVSIEGSIDWLCLPHLDSPSVFAALLDERIGGRFQLRPEGDADTVQVYRSQTNVLTTRFRRRDGARMELTDFMPMPNSEDDAGTVYRKIEVLKGAMRVKLTFAPKFEYARAETRLERHPAGLVASSSDGQALALYTGEGMDIATDGDRAEGWLELSEGQVRWVKCRFGRAEVPACDGDEA